VLALASGTLPDYPKRYACIACSDAHDVDEIGRAFTYVKMGDVSVHALKQVFYDPALRVRLHDAWPPRVHAWIERLEVSQGFFREVSFSFHPDMNCLVGGKAVGKSLLIELMRFCLDAPSPIDSVSDDSRQMLKARTCLGEGGTVTLYVVSAGGERYRIQRTLSELDRGPEIYYGDTETKVMKPVREVCRCTIHSQNETIEFGRRLPALLDWLDGFLDMTDERETVSGIQKQVQSAARRLDVAHNTARELGLLEERRTDLVNKRKHLEQMLNEPILRTFPQWQKEERELRAMQRGLEQLQTKLVVPLERMVVDEYIPEPEAGTPNYADLLNQRQALSGMTTTFQAIAGKLREELAARNRTLQSYITAWRVQYEKAKAEFEEVVKKAGVANASAMTSELDKAIKAGEEIDVRLNLSRKALRDKGLIEQEINNKLIADYVQSFSQIYSRRHQKAESINSSLNGFVRIRVLPMSDRADYLARVSALARGSRLTKAQIEQIVMKTTPVELAQHILDREISRLAEKTGVTEHTAELLIEHVWTKITDDQGREEVSAIYELMLVALKDTVAVELRGADGVYKPMEELSVGSKCTALLSVALVEGEWPLIVDQPEDALDNPFVFEQIVKTVRRSKTNRQYIFATHNPNVAVSSDADLIYCLRAGASEGEIEKHGSVDEISTKDRVIANLEGGRNAFHLRSQKYGIVVDDPNAIVPDIWGN
jgi:ABC-type dipeptide/oligopeptide/nickel transport system ATPase component